MKNHLHSLLGTIRITPTSYLPLNQESGLGDSGNKVLHLPKSHRCMAHTSAPRAWGIWGAIHRGKATGPTVKRVWAENPDVWQRPKVTRGYQILAGDIFPQPRTWITQQPPHQTQLAVDHATKLPDGICSWPFCNSKHPKLSTSRGKKK